MKYDKDWLLKRLGDGWPPEYRVFWGHTLKEGRPMGVQCFSQWFPAPFELDGIRYATSEHWMMAGKAKLFGDDSVAEQIIADDQPATAKALGRKVQGFDNDVWIEHAYAIVRDGNVHKFGQNPALSEFLASTGDDVIVEASPMDTIWGTGLPREHPDTANPSAWPGSDLLGFALMETREILNKNTASKS